MLLLLACTDTKPATDDTGNPATDDTAPPPGDLTLSLPAATAYDGDLADRCTFALGSEYECQNSNPEVRWTGAPAGTVAFALVLDDPDAGDFDHWAIVNIPADATGLDAGISGESASGPLPSGAYELENGFGFAGYLGSCPPEPHVYRWRLWALSEALPDDLDRFNQVESQADDGALAMAETCHVYGPRL